MGKKFLVLVDDEPALLQAYTRIAQRYFSDLKVDVELLTASGGDQAISLVTTKLGEFTDAQWCLFTDYDMIGMTGFQLLGKLDQLLGGNLLLRVVLSGRDTPERKAEVESESAFFQGKPCDSKTLHSYLETFLETSTD